MFEIDENSRIDRNQSVEEEIDLLPLPEEPGEQRDAPVQPTLQQETVENTLLEIQNVLSEQLIAGKQREDRLEKLCTELAECQNEAFDKIVDEILLDIVDIKEELDGNIDDFSELTGFLISEAGEDPLLKAGAAGCRRMLKLMRKVEHLLETILYKKNVEPFVGTEFDPETQWVLHSRTADYVAEERKKYVENVKRGYTRDGRLIRKQLVNVIQVESYESFEILEMLKDVTPKRRTDLMHLAEENEDPYG